jgi:hypothetical protein
MSINPRKTAPQPRNAKPARSRFVVCVKNEGYPASLEKRKIYRTLPDSQASAHKLVRVIDESGEDYLYPVGWFVPIALSQTVVKALALAA